MIRLKRGTIDDVFRDLRRVYTRETFEIVLLKGGFFKGKSYKNINSLYKLIKSLRCEEITYKITSHIIYLEVK